MEQNKEAQVAENITNLGLVAKTTATGAHTMALPTRTAWAKARGLSPSSKETRQKYAAWAKENATKAEACVNAFLKNGDFQYVRHSENKTGDRITVTYTKPKAEGSSSKVKELEKERDALAEQVDKQAQELAEMKAMVQALTGPDAEARVSA